MEDTKPEVKKPALQDVDDFVSWGPKVRPETPEEREKVNYARFFFLLHRLNAGLQSDFYPWTKQYKLFCDYEGERWRVVGASRMGDVWLSKSFDKEHGYDKRPFVDNCSNWGPEP